MQHQNLFVFDIETIVDTEAVPNLTGFESPDIQARREEIERYHLDITGGKNPFPRQPFHKVVAISFLEAEIERDSAGESYHLRELRSGGEAGFDEKQLLQGFFSYFERLKPRLVSYNGRGFDLPVLKYRAMVHGIQAPWLYDAGDKWNSYQSRYSADWHCDLLEVLSDFGASSRGKLNEICAVLGFPGKFGVDGSKVATMFDAGKVQEIRDYCETDVLNTYLVYLRLMQHKGTLSTDNYNHALADIIALIEAEGEARPHLAEFLEAWGVASNNSFML
ncbi:MAG: 3'-5' exonuclease [Rhodospirillaceae bacterium]|jgi:3'-5' exonuclease|nr:3'-5' exonuclease [Rhodospirillaceae bacterium]MBT5244922.1 3'-5' exonuclease [Rhodospirillaceae bacterium]MBT5562687.1 3'-5' exonuclease [Rhodospirillaceae bacterium]MBT6243003.1 3'-5' exonuclease [Rhodospirillaceae bacterium]MBT7136850.1 3'-5' exonuclease [Rhodospirillaceae bacterium]